MATAAATVASLWARQVASPALISGAVGGAAICVVLTITLASGQIAGEGPTALAVAAFVLLLLWCATHRRVNETLVVLVLYLGLFDGYVKLRTGSPTMALTRDALVIAIAGGALLRLAVSKRDISLPPLSGFLLALSALVLVGLANPSGRGFGAGLAGVRQHLEFVPLFFLAYAFVRTRGQIRTALWLLVFCAAIGGAVSYFQSMLTPEQLAGWGPGYRERVIGTGIFTGSGRVALLDGQFTVRPFGLGSDSGSGATLAALAVPALIALLMASGTRMRWLMLPVSVGIALALATSGSRTALVVAFVTLVAFGVLAASSKHVVRAVVGTAVCVAVIYAAFVHLGADNATVQRAQSIAPSKALATFSDERGASVRAFAELAREHPFGAGLGSVGPATAFESSTVVRGLDAETQWNFLVIELGLAGVAIYVAFLLRLLWLSLTRIRYAGVSELRLYLAALAAPLFGMFVAGFSGSTSAAVPSAPYLWLVSGILAYWLVTAFRSGALMDAVKATATRPEPSNRTNPRLRHGVVGTQ